MEMDCNQHNMPIFQNVEIFHLYCVTLRLPIFSSKLCFIQSYTANEILGLFFDVFSFHTGMVATILFFRKKSSEDDLSSRQF